MRVNSYNVTLNDVNNNKNNNNNNTLYLVGRLSRLSRFPSPQLVKRFFYFTPLPQRHHQARLLAVSAPHSGDWLHALPKCLFNFVVYVWTTRRSELQLDYVLEPVFVSLISVHAAPRSVQKALTASPADVVQAERLVITP